MQNTTAMHHVITMENGVSVPISIADIRGTIGEEEFDAAVRELLKRHIKECGEQLTLADISARELSGGFDDLPPGATDAD